MDTIRLDHGPDIYYIQTLERSLTLFNLTRPGGVPQLGILITIITFNCQVRSVFSWKDCKIQSTVLKRSFFDCEWRVVQVRDQWTL